MRPHVCFVLIAIAGCSSNDGDSAAGDASVDARATDAGPEDAPAAAARDSAAPDTSPPVYASPCPKLIPIPEAPCGNGGVSCEYGADPHAVCWSLASCGSVDGGGDLEWIEDEPEAGCAPANDARCPASYGATATCPITDDTRCDYAEGRCGCIPCSDGDGGQREGWSCRAWSAVAYDVDAATSPCPGDRPHLGDPCGTEGVTCLYDGACTGITFGPAMACHQGHWIRGVDIGLACAVTLCPD